MQPNALYFRGDILDGDETVIPVTIIRKGAPWMTVINDGRQEYEVDSTLLVDISHKPLVESIIAEMRELEALQAESGTHERALKIMGLQAQLDALPGAEVVSE